MSVVFDFGSTVRPLQARPLAISVAVSNSRAEWFNVGLTVVIEPACSIDLFNSYSTSAPARPPRLKLCRPELVVATPCRSRCICGVPDNRREWP